MAHYHKKKQKKKPWSSGKRSVVGAVSGLVLGVWGALTIFGVVTKYQTQVARAQQVPMMDVLVAGRQLPSGMKIQKQDVYRLSVPRSLYQEGMATHLGQIVGHYPRERILANDVVRTERLADPENGVGLNAVLPKGMRALALEIANGEALSGMLEPGSFVDVAATYLPQDDEGQVVTRTIAQGLFVLAVREKAVQLSPQAQREVRQKSRPTVTLLVHPEQAKVLAFAEQAAALNLTLRNPLDVAFAITPGADIRDLFAIYDAQHETTVRPPG